MQIFNSANEANTDSAEGGWRAEEVAQRKMTRKMT